MASGYKESAIFSVSFNQEYNCLLCCTSIGFLVYTLQPFQCKVQRYIEGGIRLGNMFNQSNLFYICGTGASPEYPINRVCVWNDCTQRKEAEISINSKIETVQVSTHGKLIVSSRKKAYIYDTVTLELQQTYDIHYLAFTGCVLANEFVIAYANPQYELQKGHVTIRTDTRYHQIYAHQTPIRRVAISHDGTRICTCSDTGTLLKVFYTQDGGLHSEFRRGARHSHVSFLGFSSGDKWIICGTHQGTVHLFQDVSASASTLWGLMRTRSAFHIKLTEPILHAVLLEEPSIMYIVTYSTFYIAYLTEQGIQLGKSVLLIYRRDPFTNSPPRRPVKRSNPIELPRSTRVANNNTLTMAKSI